jgi:Outer membrane protein beta-barrel domain
MRLWRISASVLVLAAAAASPALGQLQAGLIGGATYSKIVGDFMVESDYRWGWFAGAYLELLYQGRYSFVVEMDYLTKGGTGVTQNRQAIDLDVGYVEVPVLAVYNASFGDKWGGGFYGGLSFGVPITCDVNIGGSNVSCGTGLSSPQTEWTVPLGARLSYKLAGNSNLLLDVRLSVPLSDALEQRDFKVLTWQFLGRWSTGLSGD